MLICPDCTTNFDFLSDQCSKCGWECQEKEGIPLYLSTKTKKDGLFSQYINNYHDISVDDIAESIQNNDYLLTQNKKLLSYLPSVAGLNVCEIGVGKGYLMDGIIKKNPLKLVGVDISIPYLREIQKKSYKNVDLIFANAENLPYVNEFDIIIAADIIEHVFNVGDFLYSVNRALKPGGILIVKTPDNEDINMYSQLRGCKYNFVHLRNFNKKTLKTILNGAGFRINNYIYDGFYPEKKRQYIKKISIINYLCDRFFERKFSSVHQVNEINNFIGNILMKPIEITLITQKEKECLSF